MKLFFIAISMLVLTIVVYIGSRKIYLRYSTPITLPILISTISIIILLFSLNVTYDTYMIGGKWINQLLGPAVVALAYPLYKQINMVKMYFIPIVGGVFVGTVLALVTGLGFSKWLHLNEIVMYSLLPKSVTTPVAMDVAEVFGGVPALAAVFVMIAGIGGAVIGPFILKWFKIDHFLARGLGLGSAAHAIGTSKALEYGEQEGAISSVAMTLSAIFTSILAPIVVMVFG